MSKPSQMPFAPIAVVVEAGRKYAWCACGRSHTQPFCDGSHRGTGFVPLFVTAEKSEEVWFCTCKKTKSAPWCDGTHNTL